MTDDKLPPLDGYVYIAGFSNNVLYYFSFFFSWPSTVLQFLSKKAPAREETILEINPKAHLHNSFRM